VTNVQLKRQLQRLEYLLEKARGIEADFELQGHWGNYMCVLVAGFLENALKELYGDRARRCASPDVASFVLRTLERVQNPKAKRFEEVASAFSGEWGRALEAHLGEDGGRRRSALDSIMSNRHLIAHGKSTSVSVGRIREYLGPSVEVLNFIEAQCA